MTKKGRTFLQIFKKSFLNIAKTKFKKKNLQFFKTKIGDFAIVHF